VELMPPKQKYYQSGRQREYMRLSKLEPSKTNGIIIESIVHLNGRVMVNAEKMEKSFYVKKQRYSFGVIFDTDIYSPWSALMSFREKMAEAIRNHRKRG